MCMGRTQHSSRVWSYRLISADTIEPKNEEERTKSLTRAQQTVADMGATVATVDMGQTFWGSAGVS